MSKIRNKHGKGKATDYRLTDKMGGWGEGGWWGGGGDKERKPHESIPRGGQGERIGGDEEVTDLGECSKDFEETKSNGSKRRVMRKKKTYQKNKTRAQGGAQSNEMETKEKPKRVTD